MKVTPRGVVRTTLLSSTAGLLLGVPLLSTIPSRLRGQEQPSAATVIRGQSPQGSGPFGRLLGGRSGPPSSPNVAADLSEQAAPAQSNPSLIGRVMGQSTTQPVSTQPTRSQLRAQAKFMRRNPYAARIMMLQQQQQLLQQQQQALEEDYADEAIPDPSVFDSLSIDESEWADAPGRKITELVPLESNSKPWWETGEKPANSRGRRNQEDEPAEPAAEKPAVIATSPPAAPVVPDSEPNLAPALADTPAAATPSSVNTPQTSTRPAAEALPEWSLSFPEASPPATTQPAAGGATAPAAQNATPPITAAASSPTAPPPLPTTADLSPAPLSVEETYVPPEPDFAPPAPAAAVPPTPAAPAVPRDTLPQPAAPGTPVVPTAPGQLATEEPRGFPSADEPATPAASPSVPSEVPPAVAAEPAIELPPLPAGEAPSGPFTGLRLEDVPAPAPLIPTAPQAESAPSPADEFLPPKPLESPLPEGLSAPFPSTPFLDAAPAIEDSFELPPAPGAAVSAEPGPDSAGHTADSRVPTFTPAPGSGTGMDRHLTVPNPAPFIPPEPDDFGGAWKAPAEDYYLPPSVATTPSIASPPQSAPATTTAPSTLAPDITLWAPAPAAREDLKAPDPIVAPSTAKRLIAAPPPSPQETNAKLERIAARKGLNGFKGFCPVAIKDHRELIDARPEFSAVYNGRRYFFSSAASQALFEANPEAYAPAALGNDVVHLMLTGESRAGSLEHAVWYRSRLYMFATAETMETFVASPSIHAWEE